MKSGNGLPRQRLLKAQVPCFTVFLLVAFWMILINGSTPPVLRIKSLYWAQSPAMFPMAQTAYSAMSENYDESNLTNNAIPPLSIIV